MGTQLSVDLGLQHRRISERAPCPPAKRRYFDFGIHCFGDLIYGEGVNVAPMRIPGVADHDSEVPSIMVPMIGRSATAAWMEKLELLEVIGNKRERCSTNEKRLTVALIDFGLEW